MIDKSKCLYYKGFYGSVEYCAESHMLYGKILGIPGLLAMYDGKSLDALVKDFKEAVDHHILSEEIEEAEFATPEQVKEGVLT